MNAANSPQLGEPVAAVKSYEHLAALWREANPELRPVVASVRNRISELADR